MPAAILVSLNEPFFTVVEVGEGSGSAGLWLGEDEAIGVEGGVGVTAARSDPEQLDASTSTTASSARTCIDSRVTHRLAARESLGGPAAGRAGIDGVRRRRYGRAG